LGKKVKQLRVKEWIPAVVYSPDMPTRPIQVEERSLRTTLHQAGSTQLIDLYVDEESDAHVVLAREIQRDVLTGRVLHVDFYQVRLTEKVRTTPRLELVGESPLVKAGGAVLIHGMTEVDVECLPTDLIDYMEVDVSGLETLDDNVLVRDLPVPPELTVLAEPEDVVVSLVAVRVLEEEEPEMEELEAVEGEELADEEEEEA
jgi:large subunit ribosomal protein L25